MIPTAQPLDFSPSLVGTFLCGIVEECQPYRVNGMSVWIEPVRGHEKCPEPNCGERFNKSNGFLCVRHNQRPRRMLVGFSGADVMEALGKRKVTKSYNSEGFPITCEMAQWYLKKIKEEKKSGTFNLRDYVEKDRNRMRFANYSQEYLAHLAGRVERGDFSHRHYKNTKGVFKHLAWFDRHDIRTINRGLIQKWVNEYTGTTDKVKNWTMRRLREMLNWAYENEDIPSRARQMPFIAVDETMPVALTRAQQLKIIKKADKRHRPILEFAMLTGHRPSVIRALQVQDLDWRRGIYITRRRFDNERLKDGLKTKKRKEAAYPLERVRHIIEKTLKGRVYGPQTFIFEYQHKMTKKWVHYTKDSLQAAYTAARDKAEVSKEATLYSFTRHSMASQLAEAGANNDQIADVLDNSGKVVQERYKTVTVKNRDNVYSLLSAKTEPKKAGRK